LQRRDVWWVRIILGATAGLLLWLIWHISMTSSPEIASIEFRTAICQSIFGANNSLPTNSQTDLTPAIWRFMLAAFLLLGVAFTSIKPSSRFILWICGIFFYSVFVIYNFQFFKIIIPWSGPTILLSCAYLCGTIVYLETEKIERRRKLAVDLQLQSEEERKRIAKDLHDETMPSISGVLRLVDQLSEQDRNNPIPVEMRARLESCLSEMRRVVNDLHPAALEEFGLSISAAHMVEEFGRQSGIRSVFSDTSDGAQLPSFHQMCVYRIIQEGLNNVAKHSKGSEVNVSIECIDNSLIVRIADNGVGLAGLERKPGCYGMQSISHRAQLVAGSVQWKASDKFDSGTTIIVTIPLPEQESAPIRQSQSKSVLNN
jgi:signal transduction histidine kinase